MDPNNPFAFLIQAIIGGTVEAVAGKALEATPRAAERARALMSLVERQPLSATEPAVTAAVAAARQEIIDQYREADLTLSDETARAMVALLNHPPFVEEVARVLLFRGQPDLARLHQHYLDQDGAGAQWEALEEPLLEFFTAIERHMLGDATLGPVLRETRAVASLARVEQDSAYIAVVMRQALEVQMTIAAGTQQSTVDMRRLVKVAGRQEAYLGQIRELLQQILAQMAAPAAGQAAPVAVYAGAELPYLRTLRRECNRLPLALRVTAGSAAQDAGRQPSLDQVYVDLQVQTAPALDDVLARLAVPPDEWPALRRKLGAAAPGGRAPRGGDAELAEAAEGWRQIDVRRLRADADEWKQHPLAPWAQEPARLHDALAPLLALEAMKANRQMVLLGDPGSGKSTLVNHLAYMLAGARLGEATDWQTRLHAAFPQPLLPLRVILRRWSAGLHAGSPHGLELAYQALDDLHSGLGRRELVDACERGQALVLFDGLDETPIVAGDGDAIDRRGRIVAAVSAFCTAHPACYVLVTSRVKPYQQAQSPYRIGDLPDFMLARLEDARIDLFVRRWYEELAHRDPARADAVPSLRNRLLHEIGRKPDLREMAGTPILLTMLAAINAGQPLPESRAAVYHACVEQLLYTWDEAKLEDTRHVPAQPGAETPPAPTLERLLAEPGVAKKRADFERVLWEVTYAAHEQSGRRQADLPAATLEHKLATLHSDPHKGKEWASRVVDFLRQRSGLLVENETGVFSYPHPSFQEYMTARWLLEQDDCPQEAAAKAAYDHWREVILLACGYLANEAKSFTRVVNIIDELAAVDGSDGAHWPRLLVAGQAWKEFDGRNRQVSDRGAMLRAELPRKLTKVMQTGAATPAQRRDAGLLAAAIADPPAALAGDPELVTLPEYRGDGRPYVFRIGQYPVTNAQYRRFVAAGGYNRTQPWWTEELAQGMMRFRSKWPDGPAAADDDRFNHDTQPVVAVSWYEAMAYCAWLTARLRKAGRLDAQHAVRLPTVGEWVWAAAGAARRTYAWGETFDPACANTGESGLEQSTPVHMYPQGATPAAAGHEPIWDLCGNVWEWTVTKSGTAEWLWLKGGSWYEPGDKVTTAARAGYDPRFRDYRGFRVVVVPISRLSSES
ncbi:MAG: SUMF1/EgtB/PvdO family nonheme iron enzyme [Caldilinea sp.]|nr:SUMF1/EgtB/PvdO family nonheme iron enzyme [Caldilinea sp.]